MSQTELFSIAYVSKTVEPLTGGELDEIHQVSMKNNAKHGITGLLIYFDRGAFVQIIEGVEVKVDALLKKIKADPRHKDLRVFAQGYHKRRKFPEWSMAFRSEENLSQPLIDSSKSLFRAIENSPIILEITDSRIEFFRSIANSKL